jgi:hypothetical protein
LFKWEKSASEKIRVKDGSSRELRRELVPMCKTIWG